MISTPKKKTGRRAAYHTSSITGLPVVGLARRPSDRRWRIVGTNIMFTEPDEQRAIQRFEEWQRQQAGSASIAGTIGHYLPGEENAAHADFFQRAAELDHDGWPTMIDLEDGGRLVIDPSLSPAQWRWLAVQLANRPQWCAQQAGIEQLAYIKTLQRPEPLPSFDAIATAWKDHSRVTPGQRTKVAKAWTDFIATTSLQSIADIDANTAIRFRDNVYSRPISPKQQQHLFSGVRRILRFARERALAIKTITAALDCLSILKPSNTTVNLDPHPISKADWTALLAKSTGDDRAMVLLMLNAAMYIREVTRLKWSDIKDGKYLVTNREKKGKIVRCAVLWPETLKALEQVKRCGACIFYNHAKVPLGVRGAQLRFARLAKLAKVPNVTASHLRDGAFTAAVQANVTERLCALLVGHRCGMADHYVLRKPDLVAPACAAVHAYYF